MTRLEAIEYLQKKVKDGEPVFVLRAQDKFFASTIRMWAGFLRSEYEGGFGPKHKKMKGQSAADRLEGGPSILSAKQEAKIEGAMRIADAGMNWRHQKIPD